MFTTTRITSFSYSTKTILLRSISSSLKQNTSNILTKTTNLSTKTQQNNKTPNTPVNHPTDRLYTLALETLAKHREEKLQLAESLQKQADDLLSKDSSETAKNIARALGFRKETALIEAEINELETHRKFKNGKYDIRIPVFRHLAENAFKENFTKTMDHLKTYNIVENYLPESAYSMINSDFHLEFAALKERSADKNTYTKANNPYKIRPFTKLIPVEQLLDAPLISATPFVRDERLYTIMMVDIDHPDEESGTYKERCHWLVSDIPINITTCENKTITANDGTTVIPYLPPHPARGTPEHRYIFVLLEQSGKMGTNLLQIENVEKARAINSSNLIKGNKMIIRGVTGFRCVWDSTVTKIYEDILGCEYEPVFGKPPVVKPNLMEDGRRKPRYMNM